MTRHAALVAAMLLVAPPSSAAAGGLSFAGFSRATTVQDLRQRFPTSSFLDNYVYVSDADARDHIYGVEVPGRHPLGRLRLFFERPAERTTSQRPEYPSCARVESAVQAVNGPPSSARHFMEERSQNRELLWERDGEILLLRCFRGGKGKGDFLTEAITIEPKARR